MSEKSSFERLAAIDVSPHIEKKGNLSYLSWAWAVDQLLRADPKANWGFAQPVQYPDGTMMVVCAVTAFDKTMTMHLPVMDYKNKPIANPDAFAINTAMMRCLVKCIALHGLGLYIYAGEDLPLEQEVKKPAPLASAKGAVEEVFNKLPVDMQIICTDLANHVINEFNAGKEIAAFKAWQTGAAHDGDRPIEGYDNDLKMAVWSKLPSQVRAAIKRIGNEQKGQS